MGLWRSSRSYEAALSIVRISEQELQNIGSVLLLADPVSTNNPGVGVSPNHTKITITRDGQPAAMARGGIIKRQGVPHQVGALVTSFCIKSDPICDSEKVETIPEVIAAAFFYPLHLEYDICCGDFPVASVLGEAFAHQMANGFNRCPGGRVCLFDNYDGTGDWIALDPGEYPDLRQQGFDNRAGSFWNRTNHGGQEGLVAAFHDDYQLGIVGNRWNTLYFTPENFPSISWPYLRDKVSSVRIFSISMGMEPS